MVDDATEEDFKSAMADLAKEQREAINAMDRFDNRLRQNRPVGQDNSSSSEDEGG